MKIGLIDGLPDGEVTYPAPGFSTHFPGFRKFSIRYSSAGSLLVAEKAISFPSGDHESSVWPFEL